MSNVSIVMLKDAKPYVEVESLEKLEELICASTPTMLTAYSGLDQNNKFYREMCIPTSSIECYFLPEEE